MSSIPPPPPREQLCNRYCSNKHTLSCPCCSARRHALGRRPIDIHVLRRHCLAATLQLVQAQPEAEHPLFVLQMHVHPVSQLQAPVHNGASQMARLPEHAQLKECGHVPSHSTVHAEQVMQRSFCQHLTVTSISTNKPCRHSRQSQTHPGHMPQQCVPRPAGRARRPRRSAAETHTRGTSWHCMLVQTCTCSYTGCRKALLFSRPNRVSRATSVPVHFIVAEY
jgi:hypothetical protein